MPINLQNFLPFEMTEGIMDKLCFAETLVISCLPSKEPNAKEPAVPNDCSCFVCKWQAESSEQEYTSSSGGFARPSHKKISWPQYRTERITEDSRCSISDKTSIEFNDIFFQDESQIEPIKKLSNLQCLTISHSFDLTGSEPTGARTISIGRTGFGRTKLSVNVITRFNQDNYDVGTTTTSRLDSRLHTLVENSTEHMKKSDADFVERECSFILSKSFYECEFSHRSGLEKTILSKKFPLNQADNLLLEGAKFILLRYIAITRFEGEFSLLSISITGDLIENEYTSKIYENNVNGVIMPVMKIGLKKYNPSKYKCYVLTLSGQMLQIQSNNSKYVIHVLPVQVVDSITQSIQLFNTDREDWIKNMKMFYSFVGAPDMDCSSDEEELLSKAQLQLLLTEFYEVILLMKSFDVLPFTASYFFNIFTEDEFPHNPYFDKTFRRVRYV